MITYDVFDKRAAAYFAEPLELNVRTNIANRKGLIQKFLRIAGKPHQQGRKIFRSHTQSIPQTDSPWADQPGGQAMARPPRMWR